MMRPSLLLLGALAAAAPLSAQNQFTPYDLGVGARRAGDGERAAALLAQAVREAPGSADARIQYGYALLALGRLQDADREFAKALRLAPSYDDARTGRALVAERRGGIGRARALIAPVAANHAEANVVRQRLASAAAVPAWALDADAGATRVGEGQSDWRQLDIQLTHRGDGGALLAGRIEAARRFGRGDAYGEVRGELPAGAGNSVYLLAGTTPSADFRPRWQVGGGGRARVVNGAAPTVLTLDTRHADYRSGRITLINPGMEQYLNGGRAWLTVQSINLLSDGKLLSGVLGRADVLASDKLRMFAGAANAPDLDQGLVSRTRSLFAGAAVEISPGLGLRVSVARDRPTVGANRTGLSLGTTVRF